MKRFFAALAMTVVLSPVFAIGDRVPPASWQSDLPLRATDLPAEIFPAIDPASLRQRDADPARMGEPLQFAEPFASQIELTRTAHADTLAGGDRIWRLRVEVPGATDINIGFSGFELPAGARLHIYDADRSFFQGGWGEADSRAHGEFWTPVVPGDSAIIELFVPAGTTPPTLVVEQVAGGYRDFFGHSGGPYMVKQGSCNNDVICPEGDPWRDEIRSVAVYQRNGSWACTGTLINDVPGSLTPWFLTANHCGITSGNDHTVVVYWNFESSSCGDLGGGSLADNQTGVIYRASRSDVDMALVELEELPAESFDVHYAGWDRSNAQPGGAVGIHHPGTDEKAISFAQSDLATTASCIGGPGTANTHWEVPFWNDGTTEPGSSGSGIWNPQNKRLIGFLSGGTASCSNTSGYDCYGKFAIAWDGSSASSRLRDWLDPGATNPSGIDGTDPKGFELVPATTGISQCGFADIDLAVELTATGSFADPVSLSTTGLPAGVSDSFSPNPVIPPGTSQLTLGNLAAAGSGSFAFDIEGSGGGLDRAVGIELTLAETLPAAIAITSPADGAAGVSATPTVAWNGSAGAASYALEIAEDPGFASLAYSATETGTSHTVTAALDTGTRYWLRVRPDNACGPGEWSPDIVFTTATAPGDCPLDSRAISLLSEGFDGTGLPTGWSTAGSSGTTTWVSSSDQFFAGSHSIFAENVGSISDQRLSSPAVALPASATGLFVTFQSWQSIESKSTGGCYDGGLIEVSTDGGASFSPLPEAAILVRPFDGPISGNASNPLGGRPGWCGDPRDFWERYAVDLAAFAGEEIRLRLRLGTDQAVGREGWYVDDFEVRACQPAGPIIFQDRFEDAPLR